MLPSPPPSPPLPLPLAFFATTRVNLCRWLTYLIADDYEMAFLLLQPHFRGPPVDCCLLVFFLLLVYLQLILLLSACNYNGSNILIVSLNVFSIEFTAPKFHSKYCYNEAIKYVVFHSGWNIQCGCCNSVEFLFFF